MFEFTEDEYKALCKKAMLNEEMCKIFELKIKGYSNIEIAMILNISDSTLQRRLRVLKKKIIKCL
jgi:DNA-binding NarL/FixJ family response regulator